MLSGFYILHKKNPDGTETVPLQSQAAFKTCLRSMHFIHLKDYEVLQVAANDYEVFCGENAYRFLLEVICGLQSPILGETEVFGQFKNFLQKIEVDAQLAQILSHAMIDTKKVRAKHLRDLGAQSYGSLMRKMLHRPSQVYFLGAGSFVKDLIPWVYKDENQVVIAARNVLRAQETFGLTYSQVKFEELSQVRVDAGVVVIAAPLSALEIEQKIINKNLLVIDLRGESRTDRCSGFSNYHTLDSFFEKIEKNQMKLTQIKRLALEAIDGMCEQRMKVESFRPFGWEDLCAW